MFVTNGDDRLSLRAGQLNKFETIAQKAGISWIRVEKVHGPILREFPVVAERPSNLDLNRPCFSIKRSGVRRVLATPRYRGMRFKPSAMSFTSWGSGQGPIPGWNSLKGGRDDLNRTREESMSFKNVRDVINDGF